MFMKKLAQSGNRKDFQMFTDYAKVIIKSGDGGNGAISFRREKYVANRWT